MVHDIRYWKKLLIDQNIHPSRFFGLFSVPCLISWTSKFNAFIDLCCAFINYRSINRTKGWKHLRISLSWTLFEVKSWKQMFSVSRLVRRSSSSCWFSFCLGSWSRNDFINRHNHPTEIFLFRSKNPTGWIKRSTFFDRKLEVSLKWRDDSSSRSNRLICRNVRTKFASQRESRESIRRIFLFLFQMKIFFDVWTVDRLRMTTRISKTVISKEKKKKVPSSTKEQQSLNIVNTIKVKKFVRTRRENYSLISFQPAVKSELKKQELVGLLARLEGELQGKELVIASLQVRSRIEKLKTIPISTIVRFSHKMCRIFW